MTDELTDPIDALRQRARTLTIEEIEAIVTRGRRDFEARNVAKNAALKALAVAGPPGWDIGVTAVINNAIAAHADASGRHKDAHELSGLWAYVECAAIGILAKPALTPPQYTALVSPVLDVLPSLGDTAGTGIIDKEEIQHMAFTKEQQLGKAKAKTADKPAKVRATKAVAKAATKPKAEKAPKTPKAAATPRAPKVVELGKAEAIVKEARKFADKHAEHYAQFAEGKMGYQGGAFNYTLDTLIRPVLHDIGGDDAIRAVRGEDKVKVGYLVMAGMASKTDGQARLQKMQKAWAFWGPLAGAADDAVTNATLTETGAARNDPEETAKAEAEEAQPVTA